MTTLIDRLKAAADAFDEEAAKVVCEELRQGILYRTLAPSPPEQKEIFKQLRRCRWFAWMQRIGEILLAAGSASAMARRQLGQALIEQGLLDEALRVVEALAADPQCPPDERAEAYGLKGRVHKQLYVERQATLGPARRLTLDASVRAYYAIYAADHTQLWHGINVVALVLRGRRDGVDVDIGEDPLAIAQAIVDAVKAATKPPHWDIASAAEACVALGDWAGARAFMDAYVQHEELDSFAAASTLRQLQQVWQLREDDEGGELISLLQAAVVSRVPATASKIPERMHAPLSLAMGDLRVAEANARDRGQMLEKVFGPESPRSLQWYQLGLTRARSVARIERLTGEGYGTGFLIRADSLFTSLPDPSELLLVTNSHVLSQVDDGALRPEDCVVRFEALDTRSVFHVREVLFESPRQELDVTVARLDAAVTGAEPCPLAPVGEPSFKPGVARKLFVIGHPSGGSMAISIEDNLQVGWRSPLLHYRTPTERGSSGSPVFDDLWRLIAVHHAGSDVMPRLDGGPGTYRANEGIWIHAVAGAIAKQGMKAQRLESNPPAVRPQLRSGVFISYAHEDRPWLEGVKRHLEPVCASKSIRLWDDTGIAPGSTWLNEIRHGLDHASVAVLLVSSHFLASDFIRREELPPLLKANSAQGLTVFPIAVSAANVKWVPALSALQFANDPKQPLDLLAPAQQELELQRITDRIGAVLDVSGLGNGLRTADALAYQAAGLGGTKPSTEPVESFSTIVRQGETGLVSKRGNTTRTLLTFDEVLRLPPDSRKLIHAYDDAIQKSYERFTLALPRQADPDPQVRQRATADLAEAKKALGEAFGNLLQFLASLNIHLDDHYHAVRYICSQPPSPQ